MDLTDEQKAEYLKEPNKCPVCRSDNIEGGSTDIESDHAYQTVVCLSCHTEWRDVYTLTDIDSVS